MFLGSSQPVKDPDPPTVTQKKLECGDERREEGCRQGVQDPVFDGTPYYTRKISHLKRTFELGEEGNEGDERVRSVGLETICEDGGHDEREFNMGVRPEGGGKKGGGGGGFGAARKMRPVRRSKRLSGMHTPSKKERPEVKKEEGMGTKRSVNRTRIPWIP